MVPPPSSAVWSEAAGLAACLHASGRAQACQRASLAAKAACSTGTAAGWAAAAEAPRLVFSLASAPEHFLADHVEQPARVDVILRMLQAAGITGGAFGGQVRGRGAAAAGVHYRRPRKSGL